MIEAILWLAWFGLMLLVFGTGCLFNYLRGPRVKIDNPSEPITATVKWRGGTARFKVIAHERTYKPWDIGAFWSHEDGEHVEYEPLSDALAKAAAKAYKKHQRQSKADRLRAQERAAQAEFKAAREAERQKFRPQKLPRARVIPARHKDGN